MEATLNLLLVEDDPVDAKSIARVLQRCGLSQSMENATTLEQAKQKVRTHHYDAVILDLGLPDSQGVDGVLEFQASAPEIPIVVLTANQDERMAIRSMDIGAEDFINKNTFTDDSLCRSLRFAIERHRRKRQAYSDIDSLRLSLGDAMHQATTDPLTGLPNRRALQNHLEQLGKTFPQLPVIVGVCDLDHFKAINDEHGHHVGDMVLREFSGRLQHCLRSTDFAARVGGDEFVIVFGGLSRTEAAALGQRMLQHVSSGPANHTSHQVHFSATLAMAEIEAPFVDLEQILLQTHALLAKGKSGGRNRLECAWNEDAPSPPAYAKAAPPAPEPELAPPQLEDNLIQHPRSVLSLELGGSMGHHLAFGLGPGPWPLVGPALQRSRLANRLSEMTVECIRRAQAWRAQDAPDAQLHLDIEADAIKPWVCTELTRIFPRESSRESCVLFLHTDFPSQPGLASLADIRFIRQAGFQLGVRNLGDGATILEHLQLLRPSWIRFDPALTINVGKYQRKVERLAQMVEMLRPLGARYIAEETEEDGDLRELLELGFYAYYSRFLPKQSQYSLTLKPD